MVAKEKLENRLQNNALIRVLHASPHSGSIDIFINHSLLLQNFSYKSISEYLLLPQGNCQIDIFPTGETAKTIISHKISIQSKQSYTFALFGTTEKHHLLAFHTKRKVPPGESKIRFLHLSSDTPKLDIAVKSRDVVFPSLRYQQITDYLGLTPMTVDLEVRPAGKKEVILPLPKMKFAPNQSYTIALIGLCQQPPPLQALFLKD